MKRTARLARPVSALGAVLIFVTAACGSADSPDASDPPDASKSPGGSAPAGAAPFVIEAAAPDDAVDAGAAFLEARYGAIDIASLSLIAYIGDNWRVDALAAADEAAQERLATADLDPEEAAMIRLAEPDRLADAALADHFAPDSTSATLAAVLRCDENPLTSADLEALDALVDGGAYDATHAALAVVWMDELHCTDSGAPDRHDRLVHVIAAELAATDEVTDLALEQSAVLHYLGAGDRVPSGWLERVLIAQRTDGSWGEQVSTWHMTLLALWTILAETDPGEGADMVGANA